MVMVLGGVLIGVFSLLILQVKGMARVMVLEKVDFVGI